MFDTFSRTPLRFPDSGDNIPLSRARYSVGDYVKISRDPSKVFRKGYEMGWSVEVFTIDAILSRDKVIVYRLRDLNGDAIKGTFYEPELQKVRLNPRDD